MKTAKKKERKTLTKKTIIKNKRLYLHPTEGFVLVAKNYDHDFQFLNTVDYYALDDLVPYVYNKFGVSQEGIWEITVKFTPNKIFISGE